MEKMKPVTFMYFSNEGETRYVISCNKGFSIQSLPGSTKNIKNETVNLWIVHSSFVGYKDFNNLILSGRWWLQSLMLRHIYKKSFSVFLMFVESANMKKKN